MHVHEKYSHVHDFHLVKQHSVNVEWMDIDDWRVDLIIRKGNNDVYVHTMCIQYYVQSVLYLHSSVLFLLFYLVAGVVVVVIILSRFKLCVLYCKIFISVLLKQILIQLRKI